MGEKTMPITGGCLCGTVRFEASEHPDEIGYCHCRMCQKASGNVFIAYAIFPAAALRITQGKPKFYRSSAWLHRGFCADCGTPVIHRYLRTLNLERLADLKGKEIVIAMLGSLDHPEEWPPTQHIGVESQIPWLAIHDDLPRRCTEDDPDFTTVTAAADQGED
jgi:hypothetical protein